MTFFKIIDNGYIFVIGQGNCGIQITETEYKTIESVIETKPTETETTGYRLREDLTWESYEKDPPDPDPDLDDSELLEILLGGKV